MTITDEDQAVIEFMAWCSLSFEGAAAVIADLEGAQARSPSLAGAFMTALDLAFTHPEYAQALRSFMIEQAGIEPPSGKALDQLIREILPTELLVRQPEGAEVTA